MMKEKYLDKDHKYLLFSIYNKNEEKAELQKVDLDKKIHDHLEKKEFQAIVLSQKLENTSTIEKYAKEYQISVSRMTFIRNMIILNPELSTEDLVDLSIEELVILSQDIGLELDKILDSTDFDEYEVEIEFGEKEYKIEIHLYTGKILDFDVDDIDDFVFLLIGYREYI